MCVCVCVCAGDLSELGELFQVSLSQFESDVLPYLTQHDCVICVDGVCGKAGPPGLQTTMQRFVVCVCVE